MLEVVPGNGKLPAAGSAPARQADPQQLGETLTRLDQMLSERSTAAVDLLSSGTQTQPAAGPTARPPESQRTTRPKKQAAENETLLDDRSLQLLMRFLVGSAIIGVDELLTRVTRWDEQAPKVPVSADANLLDEATNFELMRYLVIGSLVWGRKQVVHTVLTNLVGSPGKPPALRRSIERVAAVWPLSLLKGPAEQAIASLSVSAEQRIREGWREEQAARWVAGRTIGEIIDDFINHLSENPELAALVRDQLNEQSLGLASTVRDTGREWSAMGDDVIEAVVRRLFRRPPRKELTDSPPAGAKARVEDGRDQ